MANPEHVAILKQGVEVWNEWRRENRFVFPDLSEADLRGLDLCKVNFRETHLSDADLSEAKLNGACIDEAFLSGAKLDKADLGGGVGLHKANLSNASLKNANLANSSLDRARLTNANLSGANLSEAWLMLADLSGANLSGVDLQNADLQRANLSNARFDLVPEAKANLSGARFTRCRISGLGLSGAGLTEVGDQSDLIVKKYEEPNYEPQIVVDGLDTAQFVQVLLDDDAITENIDTIGKKFVLVLGIYKYDSGVAILDAIRSKIRGLGFVPMYFDYRKATQRDFTETVSMLAGMSQLIIADITKSWEYRIEATVPDYEVPFVLIQRKNESCEEMFRGLEEKYDWVIGGMTYDSPESVIEWLEPLVVKPGLAKADELRLR